MRKENRTVALVGIHQGTRNFVQAIAAWDSQGTAPFTTTQVRFITAVLCNQNFLEVFESGRAATDAIPLIRAEGTRLKTRLEDKKADSIQQQTEIASLTKSLDLAIDATSTGPPSISRSADIAALYKFLSDRKTDRTFKAQLQMKLVGDARKLRDDQHKMMYITSLLEGNAHWMIHPYIINNRINFITIKELWDILDCAYDDPDCQGTAERELAMPKQGTSEFSTYIADFQPIMAKLKWDPAAKMAVHRQKMARNLKDLLFSYDCHDNWPSYIQLLQRLDSKL